MDLSHKRVIVVGLGRSGVAAARLCRASGASVLGTDALPRERLSEAALGLDAELVVGGHANVDFAAADLVVLSPGVPAFAELARAERAGVEVIGELELAWRMISAPLLAVGGTNGKSTTTELAGALLKAGGARAFVGGNLGTPLAEAVGQDFDVLVAEVSSFQLERAPSFRPKVSLLLNITEDHLDRYANFEAYAEAKGNAFVHQTSEDFAVVPAGDALCERQARRGAAAVCTFGADGDYAVVAGSVLERATGERFSLAESDLRGAHNHLNAAATIAAVRALGVTAEGVRRGLTQFRGLPHRMALAGVVGGVTFYDDSKGTNVGAAVTALRGLKEARCVLIAGGRDKLGSYEPLVTALEQKGRALVVIGEAAERIAHAAGARLPVERADSLDDAVARAFRLAHPGDAVLLSPACSSFDMFRSYAERGDRFVAAVAQLGSDARAEVAP